jgi:peptidoglycan hydrolase-like protein with peptidoglycan-binding domain
MAVLREGASGMLVVELQTALKLKGFDSGEIDGRFGPNTCVALKAFQSKSGLEVDGIAGPATFAALGLTSAPAPGAPDPGVTKTVPSPGPVTKSATAPGPTVTTSPTTPNPSVTASETTPDSSVTKTVTVAIVSQMFPGTPVGNITTNLPFVLSALDSLDIGDKEMVLMALGTIRAETASFRPISEGISRYNTSPGGRPFNLYDYRSNLGNQGPPDGASFKGRGFIQLTGRDNYTKYSANLGLGDQLVTNPDLANDPTIAGKLLALFLKDKEKPIRAAIYEHNLADARRLVNGGSHGLPQFVDAFTIGERLIV